MRPEWYLGWYSDMTWVEPLRGWFLTDVMLLLSKLMLSFVFFSLLAVGYWLYRKDVFCRAVLIMSIAVALNTCIKIYFQVPRPDSIPWLTGVDDWSFPSGHAQIMATVLLWLALEIKRFWLWVVAIVLSFGVGSSRVYLGVHTPLDTAVGFLLAVATVVIGAWILNRHSSWWKRLGPWGQFCLLAVSFFLLSYSIPGALRPPAEPIFFAGGFLIGFWLGLALDASRLGFAPAGDKFAQLLIVLVGIGALRILPSLFQAGAAEFASSPRSIQVASRLFEGALISWILPALFVRLGWARSARQKA